MPIAAHAGQSDNEIERDICVRRTHSGRSCSLPQRCPGSLPHICRDACCALRYEQQYPLPLILDLLWSDQNMGLRATFTGWLFICIRTATIYLSRKGSAGYKSHA